jgi:hypothetical protein
VCSHSCGGPIKITPSVCPEVTARVVLNRFYRNLILRSFTEISLEFIDRFQFWLKSAEHKGGLRDLHAFLRAVETGWGVSTQGTFSLEIPRLFDEDQRSNSDEHTRIVTLFVHFLTCL